MGDAGSDLRRRHCCSSLPVSLARSRIRRPRTRGPRTKSLEFSRVVRKGLCSHHLLGLVIWIVGDDGTIRSGNGHMRCGRRRRLPHVLCIGTVGTTMQQPHWIESYSRICLSPLSTYPTQSPPPIACHARIVRILRRVNHGFVVTKTPWSLINPGDPDRATQWALLRGIWLVVEHCAETVEAEDVCAASDSGDAYCWLYGVGVVFEADGTFLSRGESTWWYDYGVDVDEVLGPHPGWIS